MTGACQICGESPCMTALCPKCQNVVRTGKTMKDKPSDIKYVPPPVNRRAVAVIVFLFLMFFMLRKATIDDAIQCLMNIQESRRLITGGKR